MEGRTIARPNRGCPRARRGTRAPFNGGPDNCPAKRARSRTLRPTHLLQWRAGQLPGQTAPSPTANSPPGSLQWRAGQLPGQTRRSTPPSSIWPTSFNGGPDNCPAKHGLLGSWLRGVDHPSMEGRTIARPNRPGRGRADVGQRPSMEGRTIARPNTGSSRRPPPPARPFNGGPDNCPAKPQPPHSTIGTYAVLQWRAGQLPGQTSPQTWAALQRWPSMEGRTIARPNGPGPSSRAPHARHLQWRAGQLPGQTCPGRSGRSPPTPGLQWRAGQLPGQTSVTMWVLDAQPPPSMEGRTIARPNVSHETARQWAMHGLQWRAGQLPGQTSASSRRRSSRRRSFNGGPDNCPAKPAQAQGGVLRDGGPSMEGRTIARPNLLTPFGTRLTVPDLQWRAGQLPGQTGTSPSRARPAAPTFNGGPDNCPAKPATDQ